MSSGDSIRQGIYQSGFVRRMARWLDSIPHPLVACEIAADYVAAARWNSPACGDTSAVTRSPRAQPTGPAKASRFPYRQRYLAVTSAADRA